MSQLFVYDFTLSATDAKFTSDDLHAWLSIHCKAYAFQLERGHSGYLHYQGRFTLKERTRQGTLIGRMAGSHFQGCHLSPTSNANRGNNYYVMKEDTRVAGPWTDHDAPIVRPHQLPNCALRPFQEHILNDTVFEPRVINIIIDTKGNHGKSYLSLYASVYKKATVVPALTEYKDVMAFCLVAEIRPVLIVDLPRAIPKRNLNGFFSGLESIKDGKAFDCRFRYREKIFDAPNIWVFSNVIPNPNVLSVDRWKYWSISEDYNLYPYDCGETDET